jgi:ABC-2 type transport system ATP-binding protein
VFGTNNVGPYPEWTIQNTCTQNELEQMKLDGIAIAPVTANDAYIALTNQPKGGIDDVFE